MKKRLFILTLAAVLAISAVVFIGCNNNKTQDPKKTDTGTYNVDKLYSTADLTAMTNVVEAKDINGGMYIKTESTIVTGTKMYLEVEFKNDKFSDVKMTVSGDDKAKFEDALVAVDQADQARRSNDPTEIKDKNIRLPRAGQVNNADVFDFNTQPAEDAEATDHQTVGLAAYRCIESAVAAHRFILAAKEVFGSYANYAEAESKAVDTAWAYSGTLADETADSASVKIEKVLEFPQSYVVFATAKSTSHDQSVTTMTRIEKSTHKVLKTDYAFFNIPEYGTEAQTAPHYQTLNTVKSAVKDVNVSTAEAYKAKDTESIYYSADAVHSNSTLVNAFNATFAYYNAKLK